LLLKELGHLANKRRQVIGGHFWREPPQENGSRTVIGLFRERNVSRFEAAAWDGERCVTPARAAAKETNPAASRHILQQEHMQHARCWQAVVIHCIFKDLTDE